jgi:hypothetical protein
MACFIAGQGSGTLRNDVLTNTYNTHTHTHTTKLTCTWHGLLQGKAAGYYEMTDVLTNTHTKHTHTHYKTDIYMAWFVAGQGSGILRDD